MNLLLNGLKPEENCKFPQIPVFILYLIMEQEISPALTQHIIHAEATSGNYDHLLQTAMKWFDVR